MNKLIKLIILLGLIVTQVQIVSAQIFDYDGTYLTDDETQVISGFHFDQKNNTVVVITQNSPTMNPTNLSNRTRLSNIQTYIDDHIDFNSMTNEEVSSFNEKHGIDYAEAYRATADIVANSGGETWRFIFDLQNPGIINLTYFNFSSNTAQGRTPHVLYINEPNIKFNRNLWEVSMYDISTPLLRFEANTNTTYIKDDYGVVYNLETDVPDDLDFLLFD